MKILFIGQRWNDNLTSKVAGGMQLSETLQVKTLAKLGHHVTVVCPRETDDNYYFERELTTVTVLRSEVSSKQTLNRTVGKQSNSAIIAGNKQFFGLLRETVREIAPDLIINNTFQGGNLKFLCDMREEHGCGILHISHELHFSVLDIGIVGKLDLLARLVKLGGAISFVTEYQRLHWVDFFEKRIEDQEALSLLKQQVNIINPLYFHSGTYCADTVRNGIIIISRMAPEKRLDTMLKQLVKANFQSLGIPLTLFVGVEKKLEDDEYYQGVAKLCQSLGSCVTIKENAPRVELLEALRTADKVICSGLQESFGIVPLEAGLYGAVPVVFYDGNKRGSATFETLGECRVIGINTRNKSDEITQHIMKITQYQDRLNLSDHVLSTFSEATFTSKLSSSVTSSQPIQVKKRLACLEF